MHELGLDETQVRQIHDRAYSSQQEHKHQKISRPYSLVDQVTFLVPDLFGYHFIKELLHLLSD